MKSSCSPKPDWKFLYVSFLTWEANGAEQRESEKPHRTFEIPLTHSNAFAGLAAHGFKSEAQLAALPGVRAIDLPSVFPGPVLSVCAFTQQTVHRDPYRIPLPSSPGGSGARPSIPKETNPA